jgi:hypothetical protein
MSPTHAPIGRLLPAPVCARCGAIASGPRTRVPGVVGSSLRPLRACNAAIWLLLETSDSCWCAPVALRLSNVTGSN